MRITYSQCYKLLQNMDDRSRPGGDPIPGKRKSKSGIGKSSTNVDSSAVMKIPAAPTLPLATPALATQAGAAAGASGDAPRSILKAASPSTLMRPHTPGGHIDTDGHASAVLVDDQQLGPAQAVAVPPALQDAGIMEILRGLQQQIADLRLDNAGRDNAPQDVGPASAPAPVGPDPMVLGILESLKQQIAELKLQKVPNDG